MFRSYEMASSISGLECDVASLKLTQRKFDFLKCSSPVIKWAETSVSQCMGFASCSNVSQLNSQYGMLMSPMHVGAL